VNVTDLVLHDLCAVARWCDQRLRRDEELRNQAAMWIQSRWRAHRGQLSAHLLKSARQFKRERDAAALVQACWRGKAARKLLGKIKADMRAVAKKQEGAAKSLQAVFRGFKDRRNVREIKRRQVMEKLKLEDLFSWGAITIQRHYRGYVRPCARCRLLRWATLLCACNVLLVQMARKRVKVLRIQRDRRWKEMWDDATGRAFFYDKNTGEIRWRRPQQLLNLLPRPTCNNCDELPADFECRPCQEFYCKTCFPQIHFGGKRKTHQFRSVVFARDACGGCAFGVADDLGHRPLYDAYNHRIDYGEGEWPSVWPSEIQQDEFHGWHFVNGDPHAAAALPDAHSTSPGHTHLELAAITSASQWSNQSGSADASQHHVGAFLPNYSMISSDEESSLVIAPTYHGQPPVDAGQAGWTKHWDATNAREFYYNNVWLPG
jgi:hypothetical protein